MSSPRAISDIKKDLESFVGSKIRLKANRGRNRIIEKEGVLESIYHNIFVIKIDERKSSVEFLQLCRCLDRDGRAICI